MRVAVVAFHNRAGKRVGKLMAAKHGAAVSYQLQPLNHRREFKTVGGQLLYTDLSPFKLLGRSRAEQVRRSAYDSAIIGSKLNRRRLALATHFEVVSCVDEL
jgi:hypothetical protein